MAWLATLKPRLWALAGALLAFAALILRNKQLAYQRDKAAYRAQQARAELDWNRDTEAADQEIEAEYSDLRERAKEDRADGKIPEHLRDSNRW